MRGQDRAERCRVPYGEGEQAGPRKYQERGLITDAELDAARPKIISS